MSRALRVVRAFGNSVADCGTQVSGPQRGSICRDSLIGGPGWLAASGLDTT